MRTLILVVVLGSIVTLISCKSVARDPEPESQPEVFGVVPDFVRAFLMTVKRSHLIGSSSARKAVLRSAYRDEILTWSAQYGRYSEFKEVVDSALQHNLLEKKSKA